MAKAISICVSLTAMAALAYAATYQPWCLLMLAFWFARGNHVRQSLLRLSHLETKVWQLEWPDAPSKLLKVQATSWLGYYFSVLNFVDIAGKSRYQVLIFRDQLTESDYCQLTRMALLRAQA